MSELSYRELIGSDVDVDFRLFLTQLRHQPAFFAVLQQGFPPVAGPVILGRTAVKRREFMSVLGGAAVWPLAARAQHATMPVIGYINSRSREEAADILGAFRQGLKQTGLVDGENVKIEYRFANGSFNELPGLAADLINLGVNLVVATGGSVSAVKVKPVVPQTIPIVFAMGGDPVKLGVVASLNKPGDNITGVAFLVNGLASKQIELLHELVPRAEVIALLVNPKNPNARPDIKDAQDAAAALGHKLVVGEASTESELDSAFRNFAEQHVAALFVDADPFLLDRHKKVIALAMQRTMPVVSEFRSFAADGALASYGTSITEANRQLGVYAGRVLGGTRPGDLPVVQSTKFDLVINVKTAKAIGVTVPNALLATADEVIE